MRLFPKLLLGHLGPVVAVTTALVLTLAALLEMTSLLKSLDGGELTQLREESRLHRGCWAIDAAIRHAEMACASKGDAQAALAAVDEARTALRTVLEVSDVSGGLRDIARRWLPIADAALDGPVCEVVSRPSIRREREQLDEDLDKFWSGRLDELRTALEHKDQVARQIGDDAFTAGFALALVAVALALWLAHRLAGSVTGPLAELATLARRVGRGDFSQSIDVFGPLEIMELASELEHMRAQLGELEMLKQGFVASVSHELRTPLTKLRQALSLLRDGVVGPLSDEQRRVVRIASEACEREIRMVTTLLDLSRLRAGNPVQLRSGCSIDEVVELAVTGEQAEASAKSVRIEVELAGSPRPCRVDPALLERAIANLVRNAVAVSRAGQQVTVRRSVVGSREAPELCVSVIDAGPGVPAEIRDSVFDAFVTRAVPRSPKALGVGLGLALAREIAVAHGGSLELDDDVMTGATFHLRLPVVSSELDEAKEGRADGAPGAVA